MNKPGLHFENSNLDEYDIDKDKHADILPATEMSGNVHEDLNISFKDSFDDYDDDFLNVTVTEHSSRENVNANESLSKLKDIKLKNINRVITAS